MKKIVVITCLLTFALVTNGYCQSANQKLVKDYYRAYEKKDWNLLKLILSSGFTFSSPNDDHISLERYHQRCWPNSKNTKRFDIDKLVMGKDEAFVTYNGWTNDGKVFRNTEYFKFRGGKITENDCFFGPGVNFPNNRKK